MMVSVTSEGDVADLVLEALRSLSLEPVLIPRGRIDELRGGFSCFDVKAGDGVDAAILLAKRGFRTLHIGGSKSFYKVDYAVRGTIRGVLPGRVLSRTVLELKGLLSRRVVGVRWETPSGERGGGAQRFPRLRVDGLPPGPGELWEGGPHQTLAEKLNEDAGLMESLKTYLGEWDGTPMILSIVSDGWRQSIRIRGNLWLTPRELLKAYTTTAALEIADKIARHVKEVRRKFGGLTV